MIDPDPDPEMIDPEMTDPEMIDPEMTDPEMTDPEMIDPEMIASIRFCCFSSNETHHFSRNNLP